MKCTKLGHEWAHVSCALWIPEVSIGCVERMEPITKIANIPVSFLRLILKCGAIKGNPDGSRLHFICVWVAGCVGYRLGFKEPNTYIVQPE